MSKKFKRIPKHIGIIPDGNRRWAVSNNLNKQDGYIHGISPGVQLVEQLIDLGVEEVTFYGFTKDNVKRPKVQTNKYVEACIKSIEEVAKMNTSIYVLGDTTSNVFPDELIKYTEERVGSKNSKIKLNFLINYDWNWDLKGILDGEKTNPKNMIKSKEISRIDYIIRWGGRRRLSGFLPVQSVYADFYIVDEYWPSFKQQHVEDALDFYQTSDVTLGG